MTNENAPRRRPTPRTETHARARRVQDAAPMQRSKGRAASQASLPIPVIAAFGVVVLLICFVGLRGLLPAGPKEEPAAPVVADGSTRVSFVAVGDNLIEQELSLLADAADGAQGDGRYDYSVLYQKVAPAIKSADISYVKQEVHLGGADIGPQGYPSFNCMDDMAGCLTSLGFDFVASASNHCYDWGFDALAHSCGVFARQPVAYTGTAANPEDAQRIVTVEREGITFALLDYTYGVNGYTPDQIPSYAVNFYSKDRLRDDVARAREEADVVLVAMHWGTEKQLEENEEQREYAQFLADLGVDMIIGSHPHCIQPMRWVEGQGGNKTLCVYSLGNFVSNHENANPLSALEGMVSCDFVKAKDSDKISIENVVWTPLVSHRQVSEEGLVDSVVYPLKDYSADLAATSKDGTEVSDVLAWYRDTTQQTIGRDFRIDM